MSCEYDGEDNLIGYVDEAGRKTSFTYYGQGQLHTRTDPDGTVTRYHYDTEEQLIGVSNPLGQKWQLRRDAVGRLVEEVDYWGQSRHYGYDAAGHLRQCIDPLGRVLAIECDALGRITRRSTREDEAEQYVYNRRGQLIEASNAHGKVERSYDADGRLMREMQGQGEMLGTIACEYDAMGQLQTQQREMLLSAASAYRQTLSYEYDALGQSKTLQIDDHEPIRFTRDLAQRLGGISFAPGLESVFEYDRAGRLARQATRRAGHREQQVAYGYDVSGNLVTRSDARLGEDRYRYDPLGRIIAHTDPAGRLQIFAYDAQGDRFRTEREDAQGRQLQHADGARWWLDAAGQLVDRHDTETGVQRFEWDAFGRLARFENTKNERWVYRYDALGRRIGKLALGGGRERVVCEAPESHTWFLWDGDVMVGEATRETGTARGCFYAYRQDSFEPLAMLALESVADDRASDSVLETRLYFYENEPNGAPVRLRNESGNVVWEAHYSVTGKVDFLEARRVEQPIRLQGQYHDAESNLHYNRFRYFDPRTGQFISQDPIGLNGGFNVYRFAPNTFGWTDPLGLAPWEHGKFADWFNKASIKDVMDNKTSVSAALRGSGGMHEFFPVSLAPKAKELGFSAEELLSMTRPTKDITFTGVKDNDGNTISDGGHHCSSAGRHFHNQLIAKLKNATSKAEALGIISAMNAAHIK